MNLGKLVIASLLLWIVGVVFMMLTCGSLFSWVYTLSPTCLWKEATAMMSSTNMILSNLMGLLIAFIFCAVYSFLYKGIPGEEVRKGVNYGFMIWLVGALSGLATMPFYMTINPVVVVYWIVQALVLNLVRGALLGVIYKEK